VGFSDCGFVGSVLFVIAVAFISYSEIKERFDAAARRRRQKSDAAFK
jgi:hypothetical protein